jgi:hypothetical protein
MIQRIVIFLPKKKWLFIKMKKYIKKMAFMVMVHWRAGKKPHNCLSSLFTRVDQEMGPWPPSLIQLAFTYPGHMGIFFANSFPNKKFPTK